MKRISKISAVVVLLVAAAFATTYRTLTIGTLTLNGGIVNSGTGVKHVRMTSCTTPASVGGNCNTTVTWPGAAFVDTNYTAVCGGMVISGTNTIVDGLSSKAVGSMSVQILNINSSAVASVLEIDCIGVHD